MGATAAGRA